MSFKHKNRARKAALKKGKAPAPMSKADRAYLDMVNQASANARARRKDPNSSAEWRKKYQADIQVDDSHLPPTSDKIAAHGTKRSIHDSSWKQSDMDDDMRLREEAALKKAAERSKAVGIAYNKGPYMVISTKNIKDLGK